MLVVNPERVTFGELELTNVHSIAVERTPERTIAEWTDHGAHPTYADVPEVRTTIRLARTLARDALHTPRPGMQALLTWHVGPNASDGLRRRCSATAVVERVTYQVGRTSGAVEHLVFLAVSPDGAADPLVVTG